MTANLRVVTIECDLWQKNWLSSDNNHLITLMTLRHLASQCSETTSYRFQHSHCAVQSHPQKIHINYYDVVRHSHFWHSILILFFILACQFVSCTFKRILHCFWANPFSTQYLYLRVFWFSYRVCLSTSSNVSLIVAQFWNFLIIFSTKMSINIFQHDASQNLDHRLHT